MVRKFALLFILPALLAAVLIGCGGTSAVKESSKDSAAKDAGNQQTEADTSGLKELDQADRKLAEQQKFCPKTGELLGSMGKPYKMTLNGRVFFLCCDGCEEAVKKDPETYLKKVDALLAKK
jgi:YHS domain-containing protein